MGDTTGKRVGVLLLTFGSAVTSADVPAYLRSVRGGRDSSPELLAEFARRFDVIGRSPLIDITLEQAAALERLLNSGDRGLSFHVAAGMLHSAPSVADALGRVVSAGAEQVVAVVLAPQYSPLILSGYQRAIDAAMATSATTVPVRVAGAWHLTDGWITALARSVRRALTELGGDASVHVIFTAHSLPRVVLERDPAYMEQIDATIAAVVRELDLGAERWTFAFQSAGHTPEEWLTPDLTDVLPGIRAGGATDVVVAPVQFVADHLEVLYDIDVAAAQQAREAGLGFNRIEMPNATPPFIAALGEVVDRELAAAAA